MIMKSVPLHAGKAFRIMVARLALGRPAGLA
jgi:hypothetical protein